jgi:TolB-like protein/Tfp pilus assembly protein PilF
VPRLKLFGGAIVETEAAAVSDLSSRRHPLALLALLAMSPSRRLGRSRLVGYLWPDAPERTARNRLTSCVYHARQELGNDVLTAIGSELGLNPAVLACDVCEFQDALAAGDHRAAVELYSGPFLDGFWLRGSPDFDHWADRERDRLGRAYRDALEALALAAADRGEFGAAAQWWRERLREEPHDTRIATRLIEALAAAGSRVAALGVASEHVRLLEQEYGAGPDAAFQAVVHRLREMDAAVAVPTAVPHGPDPRVVAVLPFENVGGDADAAAFAAGLHNDLLTQLSRVASLSVISRTSVLRYQDATAWIPEIARELGAGTIVEGAVQRAGGRVRLNVQLIDVRHDAHLWAETYDRELSVQNLFEIQSELAEHIAASLRAELAGTAAAPAADPNAPTHSMDAYLLYAQGRAHLSHRTERSTLRAVDYFQRSIARDPGYPLAWAGLAEALVLLAWYDYPVPDDAADAMTVVRRAIELDPGSGEAHASLGVLHARRQDGPAAAAALRRAVELQPSYAEAHSWLGWVLMAMGDVARALAPAERATELDPMAPYTRVYYGQILLAAGDAERALAEARSARALQLEFAVPLFIEGLSLYHLGRFPEALFALEEAQSLVNAGGSPSRSEVDTVLALTRLAAGDDSGARALSAPAASSGDAFSAGLVRAALGDHDAAVAAFESVGTWGAISTPLFRYSFPDVLGPVRGSDRHAAIMRDVNRSWGLD